MLVSVTTAETRLVVIVFIIYCNTNTFMSLRILVVSVIQNGCVTILPQPFKVDPFTAKYFNQILFFSNSLFSSHTLAWACCLWFNLFGMLVFLISQPYLTRFQWNLCYTLPYAYSTSTTSFRLILLPNIITEHTLHSTVNNSITHNSIIIWSSNFNCRLIS